MSARQVGLLSLSSTVIVGVAVATIAAQQAPAQKPAAGAAKAAPEQAPKANLTDRPEDEQAVRGVLRAFVEAYNAQKADAIGALAVDDAVLCDAEGAELIGKDAIVKHYQDTFAEGKTDKIQGSIEAMRFLGADCASVRGQFELQSESGAPTAYGRFRLTAQRVGGQWRVAEVHDYAVAPLDPGDNYELLKQLDWLVGDWVDESEAVTLTNQVRWDDSQNFLIRTYEADVPGVVTTKGTQIIAWDPRSELIRSWVFDSSGGFGEAIWLNQGDRWTIKATGVTRDGSTTTSTQVIERVNNDSLRLHSFDRTVGDVQEADVTDIVMVRKPPAPGAAGEAPPQPTR